MLNFTFQDYKKKICALQVVCAFRDEKYKTIDDLGVLFYFASPLNDETFDWKNKSGLSLNINEVLSLCYYLKNPNELYKLKNNSLIFYHPFNGKNKNLTVAANKDTDPIFLSLSFKSEDVFKKMSYRAGTDAIVFANKIELLIQSAILYNSLAKE